MIKLDIKTYERLYQYDIKTSFHDTFNAITVIYRLNPELLGVDPIDIIYGSGE